MGPQDRGRHVRVGQRRVVAGRRVLVNCIREPAVTAMTPRKREICWDFGIPPREPALVIAETVEIELRPGEIVLLTGPSGAGKSSVLAAIAEKFENCERVGRGRFRAGRPIVESVAHGRPLSTALEILTACGLGEPRLWVRQFGDLSDGERFRAELARAIGRAICGGPADAGPSPAPSNGEGRAERNTTTAEGRRAISLRLILCDEFAAGLHRRLANAMAHNLRKLVTRHRLTLVLAATIENIGRDLQPDSILRLAGEETVVESCKPRRRAVSLLSRLSVQAGGVSDYRLFRGMHYRHRDGLGFVDKVFVLREGESGEPLGIAVFAHAALELSMRNAATGGRYVRNPRRLNRELRVLRRLVMHPDVRGCGLGHWFVRKALPKAGVRFVECLAAMGEINPVFEKAGMVRVGPCPMPRGRLALLRRLQSWGLDPFSPEFQRQVSRRPRVKRLVEETIRDWVICTQGGAKYGFRGRGPQELTRAFRQIIGRPPVYYLWDREGEFPVGGGDTISQRRMPFRRVRRRQELDDRNNTSEKLRHDPQG